MTALPPAVVAALKAADQMAASRHTAIGTGRAWWCDECNAPVAMTEEAIKHRRDCHVGSYLKARKEIKDV